MAFDLRLPIGLLFTLLGLALLGYGLAYPQRTLGLNLNVLWGTAVLAFGLLMLALGKTRGPKPGKRG